MSSASSAFYSLKQKMPNLKTTTKETSLPEYGILVLVDIVNFTGQTNALGCNASNRFFQAFKNKALEITAPHDYKHIKDLGDAILFFGKDQQGFVEILLDFFVRNRLEEERREGFECKLRMVAHAGFFTLIKDEKEIKDVAGSNTIQTFRMEKMAGAQEIVISPELFRGTQPLLEGNSIQWLLEKYDGSLKGFEIFGDSTAAYRLTPPMQDEEGNLTGDLYAAKREELFEKVKKILIFFNLYPPISMDENFVDLTLENEGDQGTGGKDFKNVEIFRDRLEMPKGERERETTGKNIKAGDLPSLFNKGLILGLPGAGKTTILRHFAFTSLSENRDTPILLVNCRDVILEENMPSNNISLEEAFHILTRAFLFPQYTHTLSDLENKELETTSRELVRVWKEKKAVVLIDALDESPTEGVRKAVFEITATLMSSIYEGKRKDHEKQTVELNKENRVFLSSRPGEFRGMDRLEEPVFYVNAIDMEDMRAMARSFYGENSGVYKRFDNAIWRYSWVKRLAGTPLTAMLLLVYFETRSKFDLRYPTYNLLVRFILNQTWERLKRGEYKKSLLNPGYFLEEAGHEDFFEEKPEIKSQFQALSRLSFESLFDTESGRTERSLSKKALLDYFQDWLEGEWREGRDWIRELVEKEIKGRGLVAGVDNELAEEIKEKILKDKAKKWLEIFIRDHLFIATGYESYLFVHSTVMEFLAAAFFEGRLKEDKRIVQKTVASMVANKERQSLETLPMLCGKDYLPGYNILFTLKNLLENDPDSTLPFRCLAETETAEKTALESLTIKRQINAEKKRMERGEEAKKWVYQRIVNLFGQGDEELRKVKDTFKPLIPLCRDTILQYDYLGFSKVMALSPLQREFLNTILDEEVSNKLDQREREKKYAEIEEGKTSFGAFDSKGFSLNGKSFEYYQKKIGPSLTVFYGGDNVKHSGPVSHAVFSFDGKWILSASRDRTIKLWNRSKGREIRIFKGHRSYVNSAQFSPDGNTIVSASSDYTIKIWDAETGKEIRTFKGHRSSVISAQFSQDGNTIVSASDDNTIKIWDRSTGKEIRTLEGHGGPVYSAQFSQDEKSILSASDDKTIKIWETETGREPVSISLPWTPWYAAFSPTDPNVVITANSNGTVTSFDLSKLEGL